MGFGKPRTGHIEFDLNMSGDNILMYVGSDTPPSLRARTICDITQVCPVAQGDSRALVYSSGRTTGMGAVPKNGRRLRDTHGK